MSEFAFNEATGRQAAARLLEYLDDERKDYERHPRPGHVWLDVLTLFQPNARHAKETAYAEPID